MAVKDNKKHKSSKIVGKSKKIVDKAGK